MKNVSTGPGCQSEMKGSAVEITPKINEPIQRVISKFVLGGVRLELKPGAVVLVVALLWLAKGGPWITSGLLASLLLHELGHAATARVLGVNVKAMGLCVLGSYIRRAAANDGRDAVIALAGPLISLALAGLLWPLAPWLASANVIVALSNLIPMSGTDGCRALKAMSMRNTRDDLIKAPAKAH
jgi:Zn-dependent protease